MSLLSAIPIAQRGEVSPYPSLSYLLLWPQTRQASTSGRNQTVHIVVVEIAFEIATIFKSHRHHDNPSAPFKCPWTLCLVPLCLVPLCLGTGSEPGRSQSGEWLRYYLIIPSLEAGQVGRSWFLFFTPIKESLGTWPGISDLLNTRT